MNAPDPLLSTAQSFLLAPHDLEAAKLSRVFGSLLSHRLDYADLYFQYTRSEGWSLEEGIVKSGSFSIDQGVGLRSRTRPAPPAPSRAPEGAAARSRRAAAQGWRSTSPWIHLFRSPTRRR